MAAKISLACPYPECNFRTEEVEVAGAAALLTIHGLSHPQVAPSAPMVVNGGKGPKMERPRIDHRASGEEWNAFLRRWGTYKDGSGIDNKAATPQLFECCTKELGDVVLRAIPDFTMKPIEDALPLLKALAVLPVALGVVRCELASLCQHPDEPFRTFAARVQGKAEICEYKTKYVGTCTSCNQRYAWGNILH